MFAIAYIGIEPVRVSILVFVELALDGPCCREVVCRSQVSILVFVELALDAKSFWLGGCVYNAVSILVFVELALDA